MTFSGTTSRFAIAAAAGLFAGGLALTPAQAADLGGDCCADLEERVAELEATTVRKGNRKVSVKLSGQVNRAVMWWDDGDESNVYVVDNDYSSTRFRFTGDANWKPGWKIGFALEWQQEDESSASVTATDDDLGPGFNVRQAHWWVKSDRLGKLRVGQISTASDAVSEVNLSGATVISGSLIGSTFASFLLAANNTQVSPTGIRTSVPFSAASASNIDGLGRQDGVRYDSPTVGGFTLSAGWYEDDMWDVALRFAKQWNSVLFAAAIGYAEDGEGGRANTSRCADVGQVNANPANGGGSNADCEQVSGSVSVLHQPTGLFGTFAAGHREDKRRVQAIHRNGLAENAVVDEDQKFWYANLGINRRFNEHGKTSIGVEYYKSECGIGSCQIAFGAAGGNDATAFGIPVGSFVAGTELEAWGAWIVQNVDNAATEFYLGVHHGEPDVDFINAAGVAVEATGTLEDITTVTAGARIKF